MTSYNDELSLQRLSMLALVAGAWSTVPVANKINEFFKKHVNVYKQVRQSDTNASSSKKDWEQITKGVKLEVENCCLPQALKSDVLYVVPLMGVRIHQFLEDTAVKLMQHGRLATFQEDIEYYVRNIQWTHFGTIDVVGIFMRRYHDDAVDNDYFMWYEACIYCLEDCIKNLWDNMPGQVKRSRVLGNTWCMERDMALVAYWQELIEGNSLQLCLGYEYERRPSRVHRHSTGNGFTGSAFSYRTRRLVVRRQPQPNLVEENPTVPKRMLEISATLGMTEAVKYFWQKLSDQEKYNSLEKIFMLMVREHEYYLPFYYVECHSENYRDIFAFVVDESTSEHIHEYLGKHPYIWDYLLKWPGQDVFLRTLEKIEHLLTDNNCRKILHHFRSAPPKNNPNAHQKKIQELLTHVWNRLPISFKDNINVSNMKELGELAAMNFPFMQMILADPRVHLTTVDFLHYCYLRWEDLIRTEDYDILDDHLDEMCEAGLKRGRMTSGIDIEKICAYFFENEAYESVYKFLHWRFAGDLEAIERVRERLTPAKHYFSMLITDTWLKRTDINYIVYKKDLRKRIKILTGYPAEALTPDLLGNNPRLCKILLTCCWNGKFGILQRMFTCYSLTNAEITKFKHALWRKFAFNIPGVSVAMDYCLKLANTFCWICESYEERASFIKNFLASDDAKSYFTMIVNYAAGDSRINFFKRLIHFWFFSLSKKEIDSLVKQWRLNWKNQSPLGTSFINLDEFFFHLANYKSQ